MSAGLLIAAALLIVIVTLPAIRGKREKVFKEEEEAPAWGDMILLQPPSALPQP